MSDQYQTLVFNFALVSFVMPVILSTALIIFVIAYQKRKYKIEIQKRDALFREQELIIKGQRAIESERNRIASEMHDDLGSGLTTIRYLSDKALAQVSSTEEAAYINKISEHSNNLVRNMSEIIWAMNSRFDNAESLFGYLRRYAAEYLEERDIDFEFAVEERENLDETAISGERRRNIFLVFKELLHNSAKYSKAKKILFVVNSDKSQFRLRIKEIDGIGFQPEEIEGKSNGIFNCKQRMDSIKGHLDFQRTDQGMEITISAPYAVELKQQGQA